MEFDEDLTCHCYLNSKNACKIGKKLTTNDLFTKMLISGLMDKVIKKLSFLSWDKKKFRLLFFIR